MDWAINLVIGNIISLIAGIFIILSMWVNDEKKAYFYQFLNAFILMISSVFFFSWTGVVTMAIAASRNLMVYYDRLTMIIAIIQITLCNYYLKTIKPIKTSFIVNSGIYIVYFLAILDFSSAAIESITAMVGVVSLVKLILDSKKGKKIN